MALNAAPSRTAMVGLTVGLSLSCAAASSAQDAQSADRVDERIRFLQERLDAGQGTARTWQYGWTGIYAASAAFGAAEAISTSNGDDRAFGTVNALKSLGALAQHWLNPLPARHGAAEMRRSDAGTPEQRLALGEAALKENADRAAQRYSFRRHLPALAVNIIGGGAIWAFGDGKDALVSMASGIVLAETNIWTEPWRATSDLDAYQNAVKAGTGWSLRLHPTSVSLTYRY